MYLLIQQANELPCLAMPWPFGDGNDPFKDIDNLFKELDRTFNSEEGFQTHPGMFGGQYNDQVLKKNREIKNPREYYLHDLRSKKERILNPRSAPLQDSEIDIGSNYNSLLPGSGSRHQQPSFSSPAHGCSTSKESVSTSIRMVNGKVWKEERREKIVGRTRRVSVTSTDGDGNVTTNEYSEEL